MNHIIKLLLLIAILLIINCNNSSNNKVNSIMSNSDDYSAQIDSLIETIHPRKFNGVILISQNGKIKYSKAYGYSNFENKDSISIKDNFRIQSNSKQITATLILKEVEKGNIVLKKPIREYLPNFKQAWGDTVTVHQLLNMSSGITDLNGPLIFKPGTDYKYSNPAYSLLGLIIEEVSGKSYVEMASDLFKELSMNNTYCYEFSNNERSLINGYLNTEEGFELIDFYSRGITANGWREFVPAGGIISNANDLNIWDTKLHNGNILSQKSYELMTNYDIKGQHAAFGNYKIGYGYGVRIDDSKPLKIIGHGGKGIGFANLKFYVPEKKLSVIVLENIYTEDPNIVYHFEYELKELLIKSSLVK